MMNIDDLTLGQVKQIQAMAGGAVQPPVDNHHRVVLVRARDAGVHVGTLVERRGDEVRLADARRIWRWSGAYTCSEIATVGLDASKSRVAASVSGITIIGACEVIDCTPEAAQSVRSAMWAD